VEAATPPLKSKINWQWIEEERKRHNRLVRQAHVWLANVAILACDYQTAIHHVELMREGGHENTENHYYVMERLMKAEQFVMAAEFYERYRDYLCGCKNGLLPEARFTALYEEIPRSRRPIIVVEHPSKTTTTAPITGGMALDTPYYIERKKTDKDCYDAINRGDSIVLIQGPQQTGKTSLLSRSLQVARQNGKAVVSVDFQKLDKKNLDTPETFFLAIAGIIHEELSLEISPSQHWDAMSWPKAISTPMSSMRWYVSQRRPWSGPLMRRIGYLVAIIAVTYSACFAPGITRAPYDRTYPGIY
jgi:hypothetical protein